MVIKHSIFLWFSLASGAMAAGWQGWPITNAVSSWSLASRTNYVQQIGEAIAERKLVLGQSDPVSIDTVTAYAGWSNGLVTVEFSKTNQWSPFEYTYNGPSGTVQGVCIPFVTRGMLWSFYQELLQLAPYYIVSSNFPSQVGEEVATNDMVTYTAAWVADVCDLPAVISSTNYLPHVFEADLLERFKTVLDAFVIHETRRDFAGMRGRWDGGWALDDDLSISTEYHIIETTTNLLANEIQLNGGGSYPFNLVRTDMYSCKRPMTWSQALQSWIGPVKWVRNTVLHTSRLDLDVFNGIYNNTLAGDLYVIAAMSNYYDEVYNPHGTVFDTPNDYYLSNIQGVSTGQTSVRLSVGLDLTNGVWDVDWPTEAFCDENEIVGDPARNLGCTTNTGCNPQEIRGIMVPYYFQNSQTVLPTVKTFVRRDVANGFRYYTPQ